MINCSLCEFYININIIFKYKYREMRLGKFSLAIFILLF